MDENVMKAPSLLDELAGVVRDIEVAESWDCTGDQMRCLDGNGCECVMRGCDRPDVEGDAVDFIRAHHAILADMAKRLEAAERDSKRLDAIRDNSWDLRCFDMAGGEDIGWEVVGHYMAEPCDRTIVKVYADDPRAAIDAATQEGEG